MAADDEAHLPPEDAAAPALGSGDAVAGEPTRATRGPDSVPRERRTWTESGVGPERGADWTRFEIGASLAVLRRGSPAACRRELRKLHLRWWHATVTQMTNTLRLAGISQSTLDGIVDVVKTCRECRSWETPGTATQQTLTLPDHFNQYVEGDILFWMKFMIFHFVNRCTRWHAGSDVASKTEQCLMDALYTQWIGIHGPMENFVIDGESALNTDAAKARFKADGINLKTRAPGQHARFAERHGAFLRAVLHIMTEQMKREGIELSPRVMVMSAFFALNALTTVGTKTPYQALYGRQPAMLPPIEGESIHDGADGRNEQRIRHIAINSMVQASAIAQTTRATKSRSSSSTFSDYNAGDLIDYHRPPPSKDVTGWHGPVPVTKNEPENGQVIARINGRDLPCRYQDVRHTLLVTLMFFFGAANNQGSATRIVIDYVENMTEGTTKFFGMIRDRSWNLQRSDATRQEHRIAAALHYLVQNVLTIEHALAVRVGTGLRRLNPIAGADRSFIYWWPRGNPNDVKITESRNMKVNLMNLIGDDCLAMNVLQVFVDESGGDPLSDAVNTNAMEGFRYQEDQVDGSDRLETIVEETSDDEAAMMILHTFFTTNDDGSYDHSLMEAAQALGMEDPMEPVPSEIAALEIIPPYVTPLHQSLTEDIHEYVHYLTAGINVSNYLSLDTFDDGNRGVEWHLSHELSLISEMCHGSAGINPGQHITMQIFAAGQTRKAVETDQDLLTPEDLRKYRKEVEAAILEELRTWLKHKTCRRDRRRPCQNVLSSRFVAKWKIIYDDKGNKKRIIRMRLVLRGFEDWFAHLRATYAGTASRQSQRLVCSEVACRPDWIIVTIDIEKAFLQGLTTAEVAAATGEEEEVTHFTLPAGAAAVLRLIPGFEDYDERYELMLSLKASTGTKGAPRAFSMKLASITRSPPINMRPTTKDPELEVKHQAGDLVAMMAKHVDDIKMGALRKVMELIISEIERHFGKLKYHEGEFTNTGVRHKQLQDGSVRTDQDEYIKAIKPVSHSKLIGASAEADCDVEMTTYFASSLGGIAYTLLTQFQIMVYVVCLQRQTHAPKIIHVRRLNALIRYIQRHPAHILYTAMECIRTLETFSDSGFSKEQEKGYGIRGANYCRRGKCRKTGRLVYHLLGSDCCSHKRVTRSTFSSETLASVDAVDELLPLTLVLHEIIKGPVNAAETLRLTESGALCFHLSLDHGNF